MVASIKFNLLQTRLLIALSPKDASYTQNCFHVTLTPQFTANSPSDSACYLFCKSLPEWLGRLIWDAYSGQLLGSWMEEKRFIVSYDFLAFTHRQEHDFWEAPKHAKTFREGVLGLYLFLNLDASSNNSCSFLFYFFRDSWEFLHWTAQHCLQFHLSQCISRGSLLQKALLSQALIGGRNPSWLRLPP